MDGSYIMPAFQHRPSNPAAVSTPSAVSPVPSSSRLSPSPPLTPTPADLVPSKSRRDQVLEAADRDDTEELRRLASEPGGFESSEVRRAAWPVLLGSRRLEKSRAVDEGDNASTEVPPPPPVHKDEGQVTLDVNRSFVSYPTDISSGEKESLRIKLNAVIVNVLRNHPALNYFQGYHDIISVLLLTLDDHDLTMKTAEVFSLHRIRDNMATGLEPVLGYLKLVGRILAKADPELAETVGLAADLPYFSLSWVLTLMSHDLASIAVLSRLFDFLLAYNPAMISYFAVALVLVKKEELSMLDDDEADDPAILHHTLSKVPHVVESSTPAPKPASDDEDLMSTPSCTPSYADSSRSRTRSSSFLSESTISISRSSSLSIDALEDSMLSDPDADVSLNNSFFPPPSPTSSSHSTSSSQSTRPTISIDDLIATSLHLFQSYPLVGTNGIAADEIMGSQSCIFTWPLSFAGHLSNADADEIARKGIDIVCPELPPPTKEKEVEAVLPPAPPRVKGMRRRRKIEIGVGAALTIAGLAGIVLAIYGRELAEREEWGRVVEWGVRWWKRL